MEFSERLRQLRLEKGISQAALAQAIFVSRSAVAKWENGLGLPSEESLSQLCTYFEVQRDDLIPDPGTAQSFVEKNKTIESQSRIIIGFACGVGIGLLLLAFLFLEPLREYLLMVALGIMIIVLGAFNLKGNIATIHWYNRRKVTKENQLPYCRLVGWGTLIIGAGMVLSAVVSAAMGEDAGAYITLFSVVIGIGLILTAQFKYNKGLF